MIRLERVSNIYNNGDILIYALDNVYQVIIYNEFCATTGASGSGKLLMVNVMSCLDRPTTGAYYFDAGSEAEPSNPDMANIRKAKLESAFQQFYLPPQLTALENSMLPMIYSQVSPAERLQRASQALMRVELRKRLHKPAQLSGGQQQRVAIAQSFVNRPLMLFQNDQHGALVSSTFKESIDILAELNMGNNTIVLVSHEPEWLVQTSE